MNDRQKWRILSIVLQRMTPEERKALMAQAKYTGVPEVEIVASLFAAHRAALFPLWAPTLMTL